MQAGFLPTVSVIVPAYNAARTIRMAIERLWAVTLKTFLMLRLLTTVQRTIPAI